MQFISDWLFRKICLKTGLNVASINLWHLIIWSPSQTRVTSEKSLESNIPGIASANVWMWDLEKQKIDMTICWNNYPLSSQYIQIFFTFELTCDKNLNETVHIFRNVIPWWSKIIFWPRKYVNVFVMLFINFWTKTYICCKQGWRPMCWGGHKNKRCTNRKYKK